MVDITKNAHLTGLLAIGMFSLCCIIGLASATAIVPHDAYYLGNDRIVAYNSEYITLLNGTTILVDTVNITKYVRSINKREVYEDSTYLAYSNANYAIADINLSGTYPAWDPKNITRIEQGDCVTLGQTINIGGIGWYSGYIAYYGRYYNEYSNDYGANRVAFLNIKAQNLTKFYVDPAYFYKYPGWWYTYDFNDNTSTQSNDRLFYVSDSCTKKDFPIEKPVSINVSELYEKKERSLWELPEKRETGVDFIISRNITSIISAPENTRVWVFGRSDTIYDQPNTENTTVFHGNMTANWESGHYDLIYIAPDGIGLFNEQYDPETQTITSPFVSTDPVYIGDLQPRIVREKLLALINKSYQKKFVTYHVDLQDPKIDVVKLDYWQGWDNASLITLAGYTNANPGDTLTIEVDRGTMGAKESARHTWTVTAWGNMSAYRIWNTTLMLDIRHESKGQHNITVTSNNGGSITVPFYVYRELPAHYIPEDYIQYVNNSPFIPPVIQTVTIPVPGPTRIEYIEVPPSQESVNAAQTAALMNLVWAAGEYVTAAIAGFLIIRYIVRSLRRRKWLIK